MKNDKNMGTCAKTLFSELFKCFLFCVFQFLQWIYIEREMPTRLLVTKNGSMRKVRHLLVNRKEQKALRKNKQEKKDELVLATVKCLKQAICLQDRTSVVWSIRWKKKLGVKIYNKISTTRPLLNLFSRKLD